MNPIFIRLTLTVTAFSLLAVGAAVKTFGNPVLAEDAPDPAILKVGSTYYTDSDYIS